MTLYSRLRSFQSTRNYKLQLTGSIRRVCGRRGERKRGERRGVRRGERRRGGRRRGERRGVRGKVVTFFPLAVFLGSKTILSPTLMTRTLVRLFLTPNTRNVIKRALTTRLQMWLTIKFVKTWTVLSNNVNTTIRKYSSRAFIWVVTPLGFVGQLRILTFSWFG